jgi:hypothetical protein
MVNPAHSRHEYASYLGVDNPINSRNTNFSQEADLVTLAGTQMYHDIQIDGPPTLPYKSHLPLAMAYVLLDPYDWSTVHVIPGGVNTHLSPITSQVPQHDLDKSIIKESKRRSIPPAAALGIVRHVLQNANTGGVLTLLGGVEHRQVEEAGRRRTNYTALLVPTFIEKNISGARNARRSLTRENCNSPELSIDNPFWFVHDFVTAESASRAVIVSLLNHARRLQTKQSKRFSLPPTVPDYN